MREARITGKQNFMDFEIPVVIGGFGAGKRCMSDKTIAEIHEVPVTEVRKTIIRNISRFKAMVDFIDLKQRSNEITTLELLWDLGYSKQSITQAEHIYLLSERGYAKLIKIMDTDLAWEIHDKLIDEYFELREEKRTVPAYPLNPATLVGAADLGRLVERSMKNQEVRPYEVALVLKSVFEQSGISVPDCFVRMPTYEQMELTVEKNGDIAMPK